jgi:lipoprotein-anchoring transpeptidase ErfK/SrfK
MPAAVAFLLVAVATGLGGADDAAPSGAVLAFGDRGAVVAELNEGLAAAGFHPDGGARFGERTRHAVYALQKHYGLATTGKFTPFMWGLLDRPIVLPDRPHHDRVEVDLHKQVLYLVEGGEVVLILPVSSGSGEEYRGSNGRPQVATTPEGIFRFQRRVQGIRRAPLGVLYNPFYFKGGIAVHGYPHVPNYPASHGCIRVTMWDMDLLAERLEVGQAIYVYGEGGAPAPPRVRIGSRLV